MTEPNGFYVYVHKDRAGRIFYVGKGSGRRAWSRDRDQIWRRYVDERSGGSFSVQIVADGLPEGQALLIEEQMIAELGGGLVNWMNPGRQIDVGASHQYWRMRKESQWLTAEAKRLAGVDLDAAIQVCRKALELVLQYSDLTLETGLVVELFDRPKYGDPHVIYRLAQCLKRAGRLADLVEEVDRYMQRFPDAARHSQGAAAMRIRDKTAER